MIAHWELAHLSYAVDSIDAWMPKFEAAFGGRWTSPLSVDAEWRTALDGGDTRAIKGRLRWLIGPNPPIELWESPEGSPWHVAPGTMRLDHLGYWASDMEAQAAQLEVLGFRLEMTPRVTPDAPPTDGPFRGFAYFVNAAGNRIELQRDSDKPAMKRWIEGGDLILDYLD